MLTPVEQKELALHAKVLIIDDSKVFIGSANLDPRSLRINTEMGLVIDSRELNQALRQAVERDFDGKNAWNLKLTDAGTVNWVSSDGTLTAAPARSTLQRLEDWFLSHLPIENEM
jgi:putative cardiolipin synthase